MLQRIAMFMGLHESSDDSSGVVNFCMSVLLACIFVDWLRLKLATPEPSNTQKFVLGRPKLSEEEVQIKNGSTIEQISFESSRPEEVRATKNIEIILESKKTSFEEEVEMVKEEKFELKEETKEEEGNVKEEEEIFSNMKEEERLITLNEEEITVATPELSATQKLVLASAEKSSSEPSIVKEEEFAVTICLEVSTTLSTFNVEPEVAFHQENVVPEYEEFFEEFNPISLENSATDQGQFFRPRFYSDPTGWNIAADTMMAETYIVGERTPERTPEMSPPIAVCKPEDMIMMKEPGFGPEMMYAECLLAPQPKVNERKPMVFIGGVSASTSPMEVVHELKNQGFNVTVVPRIRYGVSFGFCPDLVLSSEEEVQRLLSMGRVWVKDRWIDVRPYIPKDEESNDNSAENSVKNSENELPVLENGDNVEDGQAEEKQAEKKAPGNENKNTIQEVHENVFADTLTASMSPPCTPMTPMYFFDPNDGHTPYYAPIMMQPQVYLPPEYFYGEMTPGGCYIPQSPPMYVHPVCSNVPVQ